MLAMRLCGKVRRIGTIIPCINPTIHGGLIDHRHLGQIDLLGPVGAQLKVGDREKTQVGLTVEDRTPWLKQWLLLERLNLQKPGSKAIRIFPRIRNCHQSISFGRAIRGVHPVAMTILLQRHLGADIVLACHGRLMTVSLRLSMIGMALLPGHGRLTIVSLLPLLKTVRLSLEALGSWNPASIHL
ncbi:hypothetical protein OE88DRAFT_464347 [Heliocybe sulcata]|uniref:Uncharacterized protein n=1 Tax=Heliocybe sulcata TaxID=5364 RepID=A0A5C3MW42_9AGAM|nr:hypothetical protein OE88DRAFT_464347 [Heliocybe sulcata]